MKTITKIKKEIKSCQEIKEANDGDGTAISIHNWLDAVRREHKLQTTLSKLEKNK